MKIKHHYKKIQSQTMSNILKGPAILQEKKKEEIYKLEGAELQNES